MSRSQPAEPRGVAERELVGRAPGYGWATRLVLALAAAVFGAHLVANLVTPYGIHRDELLYLAMGRHLQLFRMDFPPFIAILAQASRTLGDSLVAIRLAPALAHAAIVGLTGLLAARFGGGRFAGLLAAGTVAVQPLFLRPGALFQPVVFDQLWWTLGLLVLARIPTPSGAVEYGAGGGGGAGRTVGAQAAVAPGAARDWLLLGCVLGLGLLTKFSVAFIGIGMVAGVLLTPLRRWLLTPWPWLALALALLIGCPSLAGQVALGFPFFTQAEDLAATQLERMGPLAFLLGQLELLNLAAPLALLGLAHLLRARAAGVRAVGWSCLVAFLLLLLLRGKAYYAGPIYPALLAAGAAALERWSAGFFRAGARLVPRSIAVLCCVATPLVLLLPIGLPILPPPVMAEYASRLGITAVTTTNRGAVLELPQDYADMLGWEAQAAAVARVYHALPPADRARTVIIADNYGEAGAIDYYGPRYGLPPAVAPVGSYWFFGPGELPGEVVIKVRGDEQDMRRYFREVTTVAVVNEPWVVPEERNVRILLCRGPHRTLQQVWPLFEGLN